MIEFKSWRSYWMFESSIKLHSRYIYPDEINQFLEAVVATSEGRRRQITSGNYFWRAQQGHAWQTIPQGSEEFDIQAPYPPKRMKPLSHTAREGRANAKGIPCLYLATDKKTAMVEVRPWIGSYISVGQFKILKELTLIDLSVHHEGSPLYLKEPSALDRESAVWSHIDRAFSAPVTLDESSADYAPTQVLSELFRHHGYDGLIYKSLLGEGFNIVLFDMTTADMINCLLYQVKSIAFDFPEKPANSYFLKNHCI
jgi:hypothetical protein